MTLTLGVVARFLRVIINKGDHLCKVILNISCKLKVMQWTQNDNLDLRSNDLTDVLCTSSHNNYHMCQAILKYFQQLQSRKG